MCVWEVKKAKWWIRRRKTAAVMENSSPEYICRGLQWIAGPRGDIWQQHSKLWPLCTALSENLSLWLQNILVSSLCLYITFYWSVTVPSETAPFFSLQSCCKIYGNMKIFVHFISEKFGSDRSNIYTCLCLFKLLYYTTIWKVKELHNPMLRKQCSVVSWGKLLVYETIILSYIES